MGMSNVSISGKEVDELDVTGFEYVRSDTADVTTDVQSTVLTTILSESRSTAKTEVYEYLRGLIESIRAGEIPLAQLGKRGGIGQPLDEYGSPDRTPQPSYRGAKYADQHVDDESIGAGDKPMAFYVDVGACDCPDSSHPPTYTADTAEDGDPVDTIALTDPTNVPACMTLDVDRTIAKTVEQPVRPIVETMGWDWTAIEHGHEQSELEVYA